MKTCLFSLIAVLVVAGVMVAQPATPSSALPTDSLEITCVDCPPIVSDPSDRSLRLDTQGRPHVAYGGDHLYYAFRDESGWHDEIVDSTDSTGRFASLALNASGQPRISYAHVLTCPTPPYDETCSNLKFATKDAAGWHTETIYQGGFVGSTSLAVDGSGNAHIGFWDRDYAYYAYQSASGWQIETVGNMIGNPGEMVVSLALDGSGRPRMAFPYLGLSYGYRDVGGWHVETVDPDGATGRHASLALTSGGAPVISYFSTNDGVKYAYRDGSGWHREIADTQGSGYTSVGIDAVGLAHISYTGPYPDFPLRHATRAPSGWQVESLGNQPASSTSMVVRPDGRPAIAFVSATAYTIGSLIYVDRTPTGWSSQTIAVMGGAGLGVSVAMDTAGQPHLSYGNSEGLIYAYRDGSGWHFTVVDTGDIRATSIALAPNGTPHIAYQVFASGSDMILRYAFRAGVAWQRADLDYGRDVGYPSIAVDSAGWPHISYQRGYPINQQMYLYRDAVANWHMETIDTTSNGVSSIALQNGTSPHVVYGWGQVKYAYRDAAGWHAETLATGTFPSLALTTSGAPRVSYGGAGGLTYAYRDGAGWHTEIANPQGGGKTSLALDSSGNPHIGHHFMVQLRDGHLRYVHKDSAGWHVDAVDSGRSSDWWVSLRLNTAGQPFLAYYDAETRDLKLASPPGSQGCSATPTPRPVYTGVPPATAELEPRVAHCMDDAYVRTDTGELLLSFPYVRSGARQAGAIPYMTGFLFRDVRIPRGADITSAKLVLRPFGNQSGVPIAVTLRGDLRPQSQDFNPDNLLLHLRPRTVASVPWTLNGTVTLPIDSPDISSVVEEIVAQPGWQAGNNLAIFIDAVGESVQYVDWNAYDLSPSQAAQLIVSYQTVTGPTSTPTRTPTRTPTITPTRTPTRTPTPTATARPPARRIYLPVILR